MYLYFDLFFKKIFFQNKKKKVMNFAFSNKMEVFLGLLTLENNSPFEWSECGTLYVEKQSEIAKNVSNFLFNRFGSHIKFHWYIPQGFFFLKNLSKSL